MGGRKEKQSPSLYRPNALRGLYSLICSELLAVILSRSSSGRTCLVLLNFWCIAAVETHSRVHVAYNARGVRTAVLSVEYVHLYSPADGWAQISRSF